MKKSQHSYSRNRINRKTDPRFQINTNYEQNQIDKIAATGELEIKEGNGQEAALAIVRQHLTDMLEFNNVTINAECLLNLIEQFKFIPLADIKTHEVLRAYYKIEDLHKYMIR